MRQVLPLAQQAENWAPEVLELKHSMSIPNLEKMLLLPNLLAGHDRSERAEEPASNTEERITKLTRVWLRLPCSHAAGMELRAKPPVLANLPQGGRAETLVPGKPASQLGLVDKITA